jgi:hypothetical protein
MDKDTSGLLSRPHLSLTLFVGDGDRRISTDVESLSFSELHSRRCLTILDPLRRASEAVGALSAALTGDMDDGLTQEGRISELSVTTAPERGAIRLSGIGAAAAAGVGEPRGSKESRRGERLRGEPSAFAERNSSCSRGTSADWAGAQGVESRELSTRDSVAFLSAKRGAEFDGASGHVHEGEGERLSRMSEQKRVSRVKAATHHL